MKQFFALLLLVLSIAGFSQSTYPIRADKVLIEKVGGNAELQLKNGTRDSLYGILTNIGAGQTAFLKINKISDSSFAIGLDTVTLKGGASDFSIYNRNDSLFFFKDGVENFILEIQRSQLTDPNESDPVVLSFQNGKWIFVNQHSNPDQSTQLQGQVSIIPLGGGLHYLMIYPSYKINGVQYQGGQRQLNPDVGDANPGEGRIDWLAVDTTGPIVIKGDNSATPTPQPQDLQNYIYPSFVQINEDDTVASVASTDLFVYKNNAGTPDEFAGSTTGTITANANNTNNVLSPTKALAITAWGTSGHYLFTYTSSKDRTAFQQLVIAMRVDATIPANTNFTVQIGLNNVFSNAVQFTNYGAPNFRTVSTNYKFFAVPMNLFTGNITFNQVRLNRSSGTAALNIKFDDIKLQNTGLAIDDGTAYTSGRIDSTSDKYILRFTKKNGVTDSIGTIQKGGSNVVLIDSLKIDTLKNSYSISAHGDSFTDGYTEMVGGYTEALSQISKRIVIANGVGGATSDAILTYFKQHKNQWINPAIIWSGFNNRIEVSKIESNIDEMVDSLATIGNNRFIILSILNDNTDSLVGGVSYGHYDSIIKIHNYFNTKYPGKAADVRTFLQEHYNPSLPNDVIAHNQHQIPPSLKSDIYHLNTAGYNLVAHFIDSAYGSILYNRRFNDTAISANTALQLTQGIVKEINIDSGGSYKIKSFAIAYRPNPYVTPYSLIYGNGGRLLTGGARITGTGWNTLKSITGGNNVVGYGDEVLRENVDQTNTTAMGSQSMINAIHGGNNTAYGFQTLLTLGTGTPQRNTAIGSEAGRQIDGGTDNTVIGQGAGYNIVNGVYNTLLGRAALSNSGSVSYNTGIGGAALSNSQASENTALGYYSQFNNTTGNKNTALGIYNLFSNLTGSENTSGGYYSMFGENGGTSNLNRNTAYGAYSGYKIRSGANNNIFIGYRTGALDSTKASGGIFIGDSISAPQDSLNDQMSIGNLIFAKGGFGKQKAIGTGSIGVRNNSPDQSASLDIGGTDKGILLPRLTTVQQNAIVSPATALLIWNTDSSAFFVYNSGWARIGTGIGTGGVTSSSTTTFTNKRWTARVGNTTSSATPTINTDNYDIYKLTAQTVDITSFTTNLSGTPVDGDILEIQITGTSARAIVWGSSFVSSSVTLPATTVTTATLTVVFQYYSTSSYGNNKWVCVNSF